MTSKKNKFKSTTGKVYEEGSVFCKLCGTVYSQSREKCPDCGGKESSPYHQTTAKVPKKALTDS